MLRKANPENSFFLGLNKILNRKEHLTPIPSSVSCIQGRITLAVRKEQLSLKYTRGRKYDVIAYRYSLRTFYDVHLPLSAAPSFVTSSLDYEVSLHRLPLPFLTDRMRGLQHLIADRKIPVGSGIRERKADCSLKQGGYKFTICDSELVRRTRKSRSCACG